MTLSGTPTMPGRYGPLTVVIDKRGTATGEFCRSAPFHVTAAARRDPSVTLARTTLPDATVDALWSYDFSKLAVTRDLTPPASLAWSTQDAPAWLTMGTGADLAQARRRSRRRTSSGSSPPIPSRPARSATR